MRSAHLALASISLFHVCAHFWLVAPYLNAEAINLLDPSATDTNGYVELARNFGTEAFANGYRLPGYPFFLASFEWLGDLWLRYARVTQILVSTLLLPLAFATLRALNFSGRGAIFGTLLVASWPPFYFYSTQLIPETLVLVLGASLLMTLMRSRLPLRAALLSALLVVLMVYLKPNSLLLWIPVCTTTLYRWRKNAIRSLGFGTALLVLSLLPWTLFVSNSQGKLVLLSTTQGINEYLGTVSDPETPSLPSRAAEHLDLTLDTDFYENTRNLPLNEQNNAFKRAAHENWHKRPFATAIHGVAKVLHTFGFSLRDPRDAVFLALFLVALLGSIYSWRRNQNRALCVAFWSLIFITALQAFWFLPNQRFKVVWTDFSALLLCAWLASEVARKLRRRTLN